MDNKITSDTNVNTSELALVLGITGRRIRQLAEDGQLEKINQGKFNLCNSVQKYISFTQKGNLDEEDIKLEKLKRSSEVALKASKAQIAKLEAAELQGKMHRSEDVAAMTEDLIYTMRQMLVAIPGRCSVDTATAETPAETAEIIRREIYKAMEILAEYKYDPKKYEERVRQRKDWSNIENDLYDE